MNSSKHPSDASSGRPDRHPSGDTRPRVDGERAPRLPHERDESADAHTSAPGDMVHQAKRDMDAGLQDTGRSAPMDQTYQRQAQGRGTAKPRQ